MALGDVGELITTAGRARFPGWKRAGSKAAQDTHFGSVHVDHIGSMSQPGSCLPDTLSMPAAYKRHERDLRRSEGFVAGLRERTGLVAGDRRSGELWKSRTPATAESFR